MNGERVSMFGSNTKFWLVVVAFVSLALVLINMGKPSEIRASEYQTVERARPFKNTTQAREQSQHATLQKTAEKFDAAGKCVSQFLKNGTQTIVCAHSGEVVVAAQLIARMEYESQHRSVQPERILCDFDDFRSPMVVNCSSSASLGEKTMVRLHTKTGEQQYIVVTRE
jgi:hypothetical protein